MKEIGIAVIDWRGWARHHAAQQKRSKDFRFWRSTSQQRTEFREKAARIVFGICASLHRARMSHHFFHRCYRLSSFSSHFFSSKVSDHKIYFRMIGFPSSRVYYYSFIASLFSIFTLNRPTTEMRTMLILL